MLYAMFALTTLTLFVGLIAVRARLRCVKEGSISARYFSLMEGEGIPPELIKTTRCFNNFFEIPVLFYVVCSLYLVLNIESTLGVIIAWLFVFFRCTQAYIHITYNNVRHRMLAFGLSVLTVFLLWVILIGSKSSGLMI